MKGNLLVFFGIIAVGILISTLTITKCKPSKDPGENYANPEGGSLPDGNSNNGDSNNTKATNSTNTPAIATSAKNGSNSSSVDVVENRSSNSTGGESNTQSSSNTNPAATENTPRLFKADPNTVEGMISGVANAATQKNFEDLLTAAGGGASMSVAAKEKIKQLIEDPNMQLDPEQPFSELAKSRDSLRWMLNFIPTNPENGGERKTLIVDLEKGADGKFKIKKIGVPPSVREIAMVTSNPKALPQDVSFSEVEEIDSLTLAQAFSSAVLTEDFVSARKMASNKVTDERIAGLMIALEEGGFSLREDRPLIVTFSRDDVAWILSRVYSANQTSEFALSLQNQEGNWKIDGLTFGKVIASLAKESDGPYSPIVADPSGGESLVIYFEFDDSGLTKRADSQLKIVAKILNQDLNRKIRITGHADALGSDTYNRTLSERRAGSIRDAIIARGAAPSQVITEGYGETKPRKPNFKADGSDDPEGRSANRRAEVYLDF